MNEVSVWAGPDGWQSTAAPWQGHFALQSHSASRCQVWNTERARKVCCCCCCCCCSAAADTPDTVHAMARKGPNRACKEQACVKIHGWAQAERGGGAGRMASPDSGSRLGFRAAAAPAVRRAPKPARCWQQVKPPQQQQPGSTIDALIAAPVASVSAPVASGAPVAAADAPASASVAPVHAPVAVVAPAATSVDAQIMSLIQSQSTILSKQSAKLQDLQQQLEERDDVISQLQHQLSQVQEEVQGGSRGQLHLDHAVRACQRQLGQLQAQPSTSRPPRHATQAPAQSLAQTPAQPRVSVQPPAQQPVQRAAQPQSQLAALIPSWVREQRPSPATPAQQPPLDTDEASAAALPKEQERRKRSANVVMYGLSGDSSARLKQSAQEVFKTLDLPHAGEHVVAVEPLPTQGPPPPVVVRFDNPAWSRRLLSSKCSLRRFPALARVYIAEHLTRTQQTERTARQPGLRQHTSWTVPSGGAVR